jgi:amino acid transporter
MENNAVRRFGTFNGVFVPTILSLFGVILFLRTGWVIGNTGLLHGLFLITIAMSISLATSLSLSAISTNTEVGVGGVYYIISRSLGLNIGGAIGIPLFLSQSISVAFYVIGFTESLLGLFPNLNFKLVASAVLILFTIIAFIGADLAVKVQIVIFASLLTGIFSFLLTRNWIPMAINLEPHYAPGQNFWSVFAVFFPAVTGITAGVSMSGELKNPARNIPIGTLLALGFSYIIYMLVAVKLSAVAPYTVLIEDNLITVKKALVPALVYLGIWMATISSALTFIVGAPRTLQALAKDRVVPSFLAATLGSKKNEPRAGTIVTFIIAQTFILMGNLNMVATIITMFFLTTYGITNLAAGLSDLIGNPSYRPRFRVHWIISFYGVFGAYMVMFLISPLYTIVASLILLGIYLLLQKRELNQTWGDIRSGIWISMARFALLKLENYELDPVNWRPNIMVFSGGPGERPHLVKMAQWLSRGNGIVTLFNLLTGDVEELASEREKRLKELRDYIQQHRWTIFPEVEIARTAEDGFTTIVQAHGIGKLASNVALFGWSNNFEKKTELARIIRKLIFLKKDILALKYDPERGFGNKLTIDIFWRGKGGNAPLMVMLAHIIRLNPEWRNARIRLIEVVETEHEKVLSEKRTKELMEEARIEAEPVVLVKENPADRIIDVMTEFSSISDLTIVGMGVPRKGEEGVFVSRMDSLLAPLGTVLLVRSLNLKDFLIS